MGKKYILPEARQRQPKERNSMNQKKKYIAYKEWEDANTAAEQAVKDNPGKIVFIMSKDRQFTVVIGWDGRDRALKDGWSFK
jgi:hypothetical protein